MNTDTVFIGVRNMGLKGKKALHRLQKPSYNIIFNFKISNCLNCK